MNAQPLTGQSVEILVDGDHKGSGVLQDLRYPDPGDGRVHEQVYLHLEEYDADWARQLPRAHNADERGAIRAIQVDLRLEDGRQLSGTALGRPWTEQVGAPVEELAFPIEHQGL